MDVYFDVVTQLPQGGREPEILIEMMPGQVDQPRIKYGDVHVQGDVCIAWLPDHRVHLHGWRQEGPQETGLRVSSFGLAPGSRNPEGRRRSPAYSTASTSFPRAVACVRSKATRVDSSFRTAPSASVPNSTPPIAIRTSRLTL